MSELRPDTRCWDQYWQSGRSGCCDDQRDSGSAQSIRRHWREFFATLRSPARVLDLCTGNGEVLRLALEYMGSGEKDINLIGIDSAAISPPATAGNGDQMRPWFLRGSVTALPFVDNCFDRVVSQFGVEYASLQVAAREIMRVLVPGGRASLIAHIRDGVPERQARSALVDIDELIDKVDIFAAAEDAVRKVLAVENASGEVSPEAVEFARRAHERFQSGLRHMSDTWQQRAAASVFRESGSILQHTYENRVSFSQDVLVEKIRAMEQSVHLHRDRLQRLCEAALDESASRCVTELFRTLGASSAACSEVTATDAREPVAWAISVEV